MVPEWISSIHSTIKQTCHTSLNQKVLGRDQVRLVDEDGPYYYNEACAKTEKLALGHSKHLMQVKTFRFRPKLEYSERKRDLGVLGALSW